MCKLRRITHKLNIQGPVVQSIVSLTSLLVVKMLTVLVSTISSSQVFCLKNVSSFFKKKSFNYTFTNDIVSFEQLGPVCE